MPAGGCLCSQGCWGAGGHALSLRRWQETLRDFSTPPLVPACRVSIFPARGRWQDQGRASAGSAPPLLLQPSPAARIRAQPGLTPPPRLPFPKIPFLFPGPLAHRFSLSQASQLLPLPPYHNTSPFAPSFPAPSRCISHSKQPENSLAEAPGSAPAPALSLQGAAGPQPAAEGREAAAPQGWGSFARTEIKQQSFGFLQSWLQDSWSVATFLENLTRGGGAAPTSPLSPKP